MAFNLVLVESNLPDRIAGTKITEFGNRPKGVWFSPDLKSGGYVCRDAIGMALFRITHLDLVCAKEIIITWVDGVPDVHRGDGRGGAEC